MTRRYLCLSVFVVAAVAIGFDGTAHADPDALWKIISGKCLPNEREYGRPAPCVIVDLKGGSEHGHVVLKDQDGDTQYLVMPTAKITGIEDPAILAPGAANYFGDAWDERLFTVEATKTGLPRDAISLAINSASGRTQNQLHIHIDCIRADVRSALARQLASIGDKWAALTEPLVGHPYKAMRVAGDELAVNPFLLLANGVPGARAAMGDHTLVVVGAVFTGSAPGFVILDDTVGSVTGDQASGEELQDHSCALGHS
jgi:CDP-diacylglycerol pyrophosphatase